MICFPFTIFLSAFLLFQAELLMGKFLLPWFGGTASTWTVCLLFFQAVLLGGYYYAHTLAIQPSIRVQRRIHAAVLAASIAWLLAFAWVTGTPLLPDARWRPVNQALPAWHIIRLLLLSVGAPCVVLATTSPLLQRWYSRFPSTGSPYRLYAVSNVGSLLGLISYPLLLEPLMTLRMQAKLWSWGFALYAAGLVVCFFRLRDATPREETPHVAATGAPHERRVLWFLLSACGAVMLYATTNMVCLDVASVPFLWVVPLIVYLATFILCFEGSGGYARRWGIPLFAAASVLACVVLFMSTSLSVPSQIFAYAFILFAACMVCHGELYRVKPASDRLTRYYLTIAAGGVFGGALVALVAPLLLKTFWEYHAGLWSCWFLLMIALARDRDSAFYHGQHLVPFILVGATILFTAFMMSPCWNAWLGSVPPAFMVLHYGAAAILAVALCVWIDRRPENSRFHKMRAGWVRNAFVCLLVALQLTLMVHVLLLLAHVVSVTRNFYGTLRVVESYQDDPRQHRFNLYNGRIKHGCQLTDPALHDLPTSYYDEASGVGLALAHNPRRAAGQPLRIGVVGLGVGTVAAYARAGDHLRFYEINPAVIRMATKSPWFTYVRDCPAGVDIAEGDGRLTLEREVRRREEPLDMLILDAFTGDAVPMHLLTREAFALYFQRLRKPDGILAVNISNRFLDLAPVVAAAAAALGRPVAKIESDPTDNRFSSSSWMILTAGTPLAPEIVAARTENPAGSRGLRLWTDDFSNLLGVIR